MLGLKLIHVSKRSHRRHGAHHGRLLGAGLEMWLWLLAWTKCFCHFGPSFQGLSFKQLVCYLLYVCFDCPTLRKKCHQCDFIIVAAIVVIIWSLGWLRCVAHKCNKSLVGVTLIGSSPSWWRRGLCFIYIFWLRLWISNYTIQFAWNVIAHAWPNFKGSYSNRRCTEIKTWANKNNHIRLWDLITPPFPNFKIRPWMGNYILQKIMVVIPYPWTNPI